ncbi:bifunctional phosphopantothenoylcysteine decarboxylase/phosphopantothenate--cysteine ligase CoaBC [Moraxella osloensis]|uniref:Coenzyme A biosynthesis bifunctional protein CoaBC n=1 Tax=Faucicola osloensis TaxID=34062 RepID=A0AAD0AFG2_FAUOS|nr:bifunctional phosphopantothenoylcysteine decarboxylase/phosphopantothenate--cysteine ligase CoaBC [Moraxella osloensis]ATQ83865.1 bifunctional phosphopantothenoylcysteine decarboxylase/phosphopantothenate synthase [Moraxella osloensis]ATW86357.1 bifunctional phosphopantothenoylcysteine decarboxylase/phosphopantothenate--cysteine ligase CoaBC [Moraxella osloensis]
MKNILLGITGGIAAYKSASFARLLIKSGYDVRVIMTASAQAFITPLTLQALTGNPVHIDLLDESAELGMGHIELAKWADLLIIAPATANTIAKLAMGIADDLLTTVCLATAAPILVAPAMNQQMWQHPSVKLNLQTLTDYDYEIIQPASGEQACGDIGEGRLPEPEQLLEYVQYFIAAQITPQVLAGKNVTITAGPTIEAIDPVRYLSNHSTGKMGFALAKACRNAGARVTLIVGGKVPLPTPLLVNRIDVLSAEEMLMTARQCASDDICECHDDHDHDHHHHDHDHHYHHDHDEFGNDIEVEPVSTATDIFIATAAVADYRTRDVVPQKIKKTQDQMSLDLVKNPDILATIAEEFPEVFVVGFAAETQDIEKYARGKLEAKNLDMIACNDVSRTDIGFGSDDNAMTVFFKDKSEGMTLEKASKDKIAEQLVALIGENLH